MSISNVYSWRLGSDLKERLETEARRRNTSLASVLDEAARDWLVKTGQNNDSEEHQFRLYQSASSCFGAFRGGDPHRSENVRRTIRERLNRTR